MLIGNVVAMGGVWHVCYRPNGLDARFVYTSAGQVRTVTIVPTECTICVCAHSSYHDSVSDNLAK